MDQFGWFDLFLSLILYFIIFSPLIFSKVHKKNTVVLRGWKGILKSRWFGIPFIFLLLFSYFSYQNIATTVIFSIVVALCISLIANTIAFILNKWRTKLN